MLKAWGMHSIQEKEDTVETKRESKGIKGEREEANDKEDKVCATKVKC